MANLLQKIFERPYTYRQNGYDRHAAPTIFKVGDIVEYAVTNTDGLTYVIEAIDGASSSAIIRSNTLKKKQYRVALIMLRKTS